MTTKNTIAKALDRIWAVQTDLQSTSNTVGYIVTTTAAPDSRPIAIALVDESDQYKAEALAVARRIASDPELAAARHDAPIQVIDLRPYCGPDSSMAAPGWLQGLILRPVAEDGQAIMKQPPARPRFFCRHLLASLQAAGEVQTARVVALPVAGRQRRLAVTR